MLESGQALKIASHAGDLMAVSERNGAAADYLAEATAAMDEAGFFREAGTLAAQGLRYSGDRRDETWAILTARAFFGRSPSLGAALATYEMKLILARVVAQTELTVEPSYVPRARWIGNFLAPSRNVPVVCTRRSPRSETSAAGTG